MLRSRTSLATNTARICLTALTILVLSGCVSLANPDADTGASSDDTIRTASVLSLLELLPQLIDPINNTIQLGPQKNTSDPAIAIKLSELGYGIRRVDADQGKYFFQLLEGNEPSFDDASVTTVRISVGSLELARDFRAVQSSNNQLGLSGRAAAAYPVPAGPLRVAGTRQAITLKDEQYGDDIKDPASVSSLEYAAASAIDGGIPTIKLITDDVINGVAASAIPGPSLRALNSSKVEVKNLFYGDSAFDSLLSNRERIRRETIIFPNDSQRLGSAGKQLVRDVVSRFAENVDVFSVVGCSNGPTALEIGNEGLALGRAARITEELLALGIAREMILDEACWAPQNARDRFPSRGVLLEVWRSQG